MEFPFKSLNEGEYRLLVEAIPLIAILISGADGDIDPKEKQWAEKISKIRSYAGHFDLKPYYKDVDLHFKSTYERLLKELPEDHESRSMQISKKLSLINDIFPKLSMRTASQLYQSYLSFAEQVAKAAGGFFRMMSVSKEESIWIGLPMIDPIFFDDFEEEE